MRGAHCDKIVRVRSPGCLCQPRSTSSSSSLVLFFLARLLLIHPPSRKSTYVTRAIRSEGTLSSSPPSPCFLTCLRFTRHPLPLPSSSPTPRLRAHVCVYVCERVCALVRDTKRRPPPVLHAYQWGFPLGGIEKPSHVRGHVAIGGRTRCRE